MITSSASWSDPAWLAASSSDCTSGASVDLVVHVRTATGTDRYNFVDALFADRVFISNPQGLLDAVRALN